jgi:hypothetical protein
MGATPGRYSNIIIYDEAKRYYYLNPQKNRPLLDDEIRNMHVAMMDQLRRSIQHTQGDVAVPLQEYSTTTPTSNHFKVSVPSGMTGGQSNNFTLTGGNGIDNPAVLFAKGFYIFFDNNLEYLSQMYGSGNIDLDTETDKSKTLTPIPDLTTPIADRRDIVYIELSFAESTAATGTDDEIYYDSGILDPRIGTPSANRLRAVFDIRVYEGWTGAIDKNIFEHTSFLGGLDTSAAPTTQTYKIPIAAIYRETGDDVIDSDKIIDLLSLYDKRVLTLEEISYRTRHGGYGDTAVFEVEGAFTGFNPQFPDAVSFEGAFATGLNQGLTSDALNTNSVTPRTVDNEGQFMLGALQVGSETGSRTYPITAETGPEELDQGEIMSEKASFQHIAVGYDRGVTGAREYNDGVSIHTQGLTGVSINLQRRGVTGVAGLSIHNLAGMTGVYTQFVEGDDNFLTIDYKGRMGYNTSEPGWDSLPDIWNTGRYVEPVNLVIDVNDSQRIRKHLFVDEDMYIQGDTFGKTWSIPDTIDKENKAYFGFTGVPTYGITGSSASVMVKPGIATQGLSGITDYRGYTGVAGFYESYDKDGGRVFTIGDLGPEFDRVVRTLYGTGLMPLYYSDLSFRYLTTLGELVGGDVVEATIDFLVGGDIVLDPITVVGGDFATVIEDLRSKLQSEIQNEISSPDVTVAILEDPYDESLPLAQRLKNDGKLIIKDKLSEIQTIVSFTVTRGAFSDAVTWTDSNYYGSGNYGGDVQDFKFAKLDLGEAADAWLFNGDVFFNGDGLLNRVTFSPNAVFRDDVFVYGDFFANSLKFERATLNYMTVNQKLDVLRYSNIGNGFDESNLPVGGLTIGSGPFGEQTLYSMQTTTHKNLFLWVNGDAKAENFIADLCGVSGNVVSVLGNNYPRSTDVLKDVYFRIGGSYEDANDPYGLHLVDSRSGFDVTQNEGYNTLKLDYGDGDGNFGSLDVQLRGSIAATGSLAAENVTAGRTTPVTNYDLFVDNDARIEGTLEVTNLRFIGSGTPSELEDIVEPQNVIIYREGEKTVDNKPNGIIRDKEFSIDQKVVLNNVQLGYSNSTIDGSATTDNEKAEARVDGIQLGRNDYGYENEGVVPVWVKDTMTYSSDAFSAFGSDSLDADDISNQVIGTSEYFRYNLNRITIATLGTIKMKYIGRKDIQAVSTGGIVDFIQTYEFDSPYFKDRDGGSVINWFPDSQTTTSNNYLAKLDLSLIDDKKSFGTTIDGNQEGPQIYNMDQTLWVYLPLNSWDTYRVNEGLPSDTSGFYKIYIANRYFNRLNDQNSILMDMQNPNTDSQTDKKWYVSVFPRFKKVTRTAVDVTEDQYDAEWELNLVAYPEGNGTVSDFVGKMFINNYK